MNGIYHHRSIFQTNLVKLVPMQVKSFEITNKTIECLKCYIKSISFTKDEALKQYRTKENNFYIRKPPSLLSLRPAPFE